MRITIHDNPISEAGRIFSIEWRTTDGGRFHTKDMTIVEIEHYIIEHGYVLSRYQSKDVVPGLIQIAIENDLAIIKNKIETPGFYYNDETKSLTIVEFELRESDINKMNIALDLIEDLRNYFIGQEGKLATTLKHAMIVPFDLPKNRWDCRWKT